ncbi:hypothetical protein B296_00058932 [Ensete ventricosum]|uniref:Uncharacterized protein n=1 Tax=Ensete ventricosum TaxID=4639 RepID=A0A426XEF5_ENSVE|nr:hypothetical protein B296_00058932 [Ensete ventricosum]
MMTCSPCDESLRMYKYPRPPLVKGGKLSRNHIHPINSTPDLIAEGARSSTNSSAKAFVQERSADHPTTHEDPDYRSRPRHHVGGPRRRACAHRQPHRVDSSSHVVARPQHFGTHRGPRSSTNSSTKAFVQERSANRPTTHEDPDYRSGPRCHVGGLRRRAYAHGQPHRADSSSHIAARPQHLALEEGPMSQDHLSSLFPNRATEEAIPLSPTTVTIPQVTVAPLAPHARLMDMGQSTLTPDRYWRLLTDPGLTPLDSHLVPNGYDRGLLRAGPSSTSLDKDDAGCHSSYSSVCPDNDSTSAGAPVASGRPRGLSGTRGASLTWPGKLRHVNKWLDEVQKEVTKLKEEVGESSKRGSPFTPEIQD